MNINADEQYKSDFTKLGEGNHIISTQYSSHPGAATFDISGDGQAQVRMHNGVVEIGLSGRAKFKVCSRKLTVLVILSGTEDTALELSARGCLRAYGDGQVKASGDLDIEMRGSVHAEVADNCRVFAFDYCEATLLHSSYGEFRDRSKARVFGNSQARMFDDAAVLEVGKQTNVVYVVH